MSDKIFGKPITREERSRIMSRIRSSGSKLERRVRDALVGANIGCQEQAQVLGKPDFYIPEAKCALFVDSAFGTVTLSASSRRNLGPIGD